MKPILNSPSFLPAVLGLVNLYLVMLTRGLRRLTGEGPGVLIGRQGAASALSCLVVIAGGMEGHLRALAAAPPACGEG